MTNLEIIRKMSDEDLANWLGMHIKICGCFAYKQCNANPSDTCKNPILYWLQSEADEEEFDATYVHKLENNK